MHTEHHSAERGRRPLLVTAGFSPVPVMWGHVVRYYRRRGFDARSLPFRLADMRDTVTYAGHIARHVRAKARMGGKVDLIGLSMGGVASLYAIKRLGVADLVGTFVAVAAPFEGSPISALGLPSWIFRRVGAQLACGSDFLRELHEGPLPEGPNYIAIAGTKDRICPPESAVLNGARNVFVEFDHKDLLFSHSLHRYVADMLE